MLGKMKRTIELVSTGLQLQAGEVVELTDATNQPNWASRGLCFARPADDTAAKIRGFGIEDGILVELHLDFTL